MRLTAAVAAVVFLSISIGAEEVSDLCDIETTLLAIVLDSYFDAYKDVSTTLRRIETEIAQTESPESKTLLEKRAARLRVHLDLLADRAKETSVQIREASIVRPKSTARPDADRVYLRTRLRQTSRELDISIEGNGFFRAVNLDTGKVVYKRIGNLDIGENGQLFVGSSHTGLLLTPAIRIPKDAVRVVFTEGGVVRVRMPGQTELVGIGQLQLSMFVNPEGLLEVDEHQFGESSASGAAKTTSPGKDGAGVIRQGYLEVSDSDRVRELIHLLEGLLSEQSSRSRSG